MDLLRRLGLSYIRPVFRRFGYDVVRHGRIPGDDRSLAWWRAEVLRREQIRLVLDVGANIGQTGERWRHEGYDGRIVSFEPSLDAFTSLAAAASSDPNWHVEHTALGARDGAVTLNVSGNSYSSSVLPMLDRHLQSAPESLYIQSESVRLRRLDSFCESLALTSQPSLLKLDVQGYEDQVLAGANETLSAVRAIECELSLVSLYEGQPDLSTMIETLRRLGFVLTALERGFYDRDTGEILQVDGMFVRAETQ